MVATGLLKFDIFEETDRNLDEFAGHPILEDNPLANSEISNYYSTLYYGMIKNHPHGAATVYPLLFVLRRIAYALVIVFMVDGIRPYFGALILTLTSLFVLMFIAIEAHWE